MALVAPVPEERPSEHGPDRHPGRAADGNGPEPSPDVAGGDQPEAAGTESVTLLALPGFRSESRVRPFLKWAGGKGRLLPKLLPHLPDSFANYHEPFLGGGAVFFALRPRMSGHAHLADLNDELINTWQVVRDSTDELLVRMADYLERDSETFYYSMRTFESSDPVERAARFIYLNRTAWNGIWRVNRRNVFNVPWGARVFKPPGREQLEETSSVLRHSTISCVDFRDALGAPVAGDFVYLDPPYLRVSDTSKHNFYTQKRFELPDLEDLASCCRSLTARGVNWVLSNRDTATIREMFAPAHAVRLTTRRAVSAQNPRDVQPVESPEVIIVGGPG